MTTTCARLVGERGGGKLAVGTASRSDDAALAVEFESPLVSDGAGGLCTRHRVSPYAVAAAGMPLAALPPTFGPRSIVAQTTYQLTPDGRAQFQALSTETIWPWYTSEGARLMIFGADPLASSNEVITLLAFRDISDWHRLLRPQGVASEQMIFAWRDREQVIVNQKTKLLMVGTQFGRPV